jgi:tryptophanyl-tRNA synthetase
MTDSAQTPAQPQAPRPKTLLTGVKPTGSPHLGNYLGAIQPALAMAASPAYRSYLFIAEYHALTSVHDRKKFREYIHDVAATWLALGLDPEKTVFYRQGDVPEIFELNWILSCFTPKGLMNRAHAYKAVVQANEEAGNPDVDAGVSMGLFGYPVLMSADILLFRSEVVPVGRDQIQHVEIARDIAGRFNQAFGKTFTLPEYVVQENSAVLPGLDGRKMSKSYNNTIPLFEEPKKLQKLISSIKTDSLPPEAPKEPATSAIFQIYQCFASPEQIESLRARYQSGIGWGHAKAELFEVVNATLEKPRAEYQRYMNDRGELDRLLKRGAEKARNQAAPFMDRVRKAFGGIE